MKKYFSLISLIILSLSISVGCKENAPDKKKPMAIKERIKFERTGNEAIEKEIDRLLAEMTIEEKVGQMVHISYQKEFPTGVYPDNWPEFDSAIIINLAERNVGCMYYDVNISQQAWYNFIKRYQELYLKYNRLKIPFIWANCHQHGTSFVENGTIFPHNLNLAATFNHEFAKDMANVTVLESSDLGHNFIYAPVVDVGRNDRWSRFYETFGESYYLCARMGEAFVKGIQDTTITSPYKVTACAKHFIGYSDPKSGWDRSPAIISDQELYEYYVPPFQACIDAGVNVIEVNSGEVNGIPVHASHRLLTALLRDEMGFKGVLNSDWEDIRKLATFHHVAENEKEAAYLGVMAGLDQILTPFDLNFADDLIALVREGRITEERLDLSVARVLRLKFKIGIFEQPFPRNDRFDRLARPESAEKALNAARESIVLIKNEDNLLPLNAETTKKIIVTGYNANKRRATSGGWTNRWSPDNDSVFPEKAKTVYEGIKEQFPNANVILVENNAQKIKANATQTDVIVYVAGEEPYAEGQGQGLAQEMDLSENQVIPIESAVSTGIPVVLVMVAGRPRIVSKVLDGCKAFLWAGLPGYPGAKAIAEILDGTTNPSGKMPFAYPYTDSRNLTYNHKYSSYHLTGNNPWTIADFGTGLSYTRFSYSTIQLSDSIITGKNDSIKAVVNVTNIGDRAGKESVLWFLSDEVGNITRPVRELKHFEKQLLMPGETRTFSFTVNTEKDLSFPDENGQKLIEEGYFTVLVGDKHTRFRYVKDE